MLAHNFGIPKIQFTDHMKLKKKEEQSVQASVLLRRRNKILIEENMETKCVVETEGKAFQRLPHTWGSIPYTVPKPRCYYKYQEVLPNRSLIWLSPEMLCQSLTNTEVTAHRV
jgi:hypothetical protein